jgi:hypothetical protein
MTHNLLPEDEGGIPIKQNFEEVATDHLDRVHARLQKQQQEDVIGSRGGVAVPPLEEGAIDVRGLGRSDTQDFQQRVKANPDVAFQASVAEGQQQQRERNEAIARENRGIPSEIAAAATKDEQ